VDLTVVSAGAKRVDVAELYDAERYRPHIRNIQGKPMFLY
jgi:6-phosphofructokinase 1